MPNSYPNIFKESWMVMGESLNLVCVVSQRFTKKLFLSEKIQFKTRYRKVSVPLHYDTNIYF